MPEQRYVFADGDLPHFLTFTVSGWISVFHNPAAAKIMLDAFAGLRRQKTKVYAYVIMENHVHCILHGGGLPETVRLLKGRTAKMCMDVLKTGGGEMALRRLNWEHPDKRLRFWREGSHPQLLQNDAMMRQKIDYIHHNPVRRGYVERAEYWRYSSAANYLNQTGVIEIDTDWQ